MKIQDLMKSLGDNGCLCMDYIFSTLTPDARKDEYVSNCAVVAGCLAAHKAGLVDDDFFVKDADKLLKYFTLRDYKVTKKDIKEFKEIKDVPKCCVRFDKDGKSHWVYVERGVVKFDSLTKSQCRFFGKPASARIIEEK